MVIEFNKRSKLKYYDTWVGHKYDYIIQIRSFTYQEPEYEKIRFYHFEIVNRNVQFSSLQNRMYFKIFNDAAVAAERFVDSHYIQSIKNNVLMNKDFDTEFSILEVGRIYSSILFTKIKSID